MFIFVTYIHFRVDYTCQKPCDFKPTEGSLIMPHIAETDTHVQFSIRESSAARRDLLTKSLQLRKYLEACVSMTNNRVLGMLVLGSSERGTKVFRYSSWESSQVWRQLQSANLASHVPVFGLFAAGVVIASSDRPASLMESDAVYAVISTGAAPATASIDAININALADEESQLADVLSPAETEIYSDINDGVIVSKKDSLSSHAVRVATMEFTVPEKQPQPSNTLESLCWDRDKDLDRQRERFPLNRALIQVRTIFHL